MRLMVMRGRKLSSTGAAQGIFERVQGSSIKDKMRRASEDICIFNMRYKLYAAHALARARGRTNDAQGDEISAQLSQK